MSRKRSPQPYIGSGIALGDAFGAALQRRHPHGRRRDNDKRWD